MKVNIDRKRHAEAPNPRWLRVDDLKKKLGMSKSTIYRMIERESFPKPYKTPGGGMSIWLESEVEEWMRVAVAQTEESEQRAKPKTVGIAAF